MHLTTPDAVAAALAIVPTSNAPRKPLDAMDSLTSGHQTALLIGLVACPVSQCINAYKMGDALQNPNELFFVVNSARPERRVR
jgi:hypothetical protein